MKTYKYTGKEAIEMQGFGIIEPNSLVSTPTEINNPLFEEVKEKQETAKKTTKK